MASMCRSKCEVAYCQMCGCGIEQKLGKGRAKLYCGPCRKRRECVGPKIATCVSCGKSWPKNCRGRTPRWCSPHCRYKNQARSVRCERCDAEFVSATGNARLCPSCHHYRPCAGDHISCKTCGESFYRPASSGQEYCSRKCLWHSKRTWRECKHCKRLFSRRKYRTDDRREYCCIQCYWDDHGMTGACAAKQKGHWHGNARRRCRRFAVAFDRTVTLKRVAERDNNVCQICNATCNEGWVVNKRTRRPHPRNRSIDHIVPLSAGVYGHEWSNVQLACIECNMKKSDKRMSCQRRLF